MPEVSAAEDSLEVAEADWEEPESLPVAEAVVSAEEEVWEIASAVALRVPHCWLFSHVD